MKYSLYTTTGRLVKRLFGIKDISLMKKNIKKRIGKLVYHQKYTADDIVALMQEMGMKEGSTVCIHSSMKEFYNYKGTACELIEKILRALGPEGTLMMPAFPPVKKAFEPGYVFDKEKDPTEAGYLAETFRRYPGVVRSINVRHSVCAIGKNADFLCRDHHRCHDCWDVDSPWGRLCSMNGLVCDLGMPHCYIGTFEHCTESRLQYEHPYWAQFFSEKRTWLYYDENRRVCQYEDYNSDSEKRLREGRVTRYFTDKDWQIRRLSNLEVKMLHAGQCLDRMVELGRRGVTMYYVPSPKNYSFG